MVWSRARIGFLCAAMTLARPEVGVADPAPAAPLATLQLKDGRLLHNVKVMSDEGQDIVVHADEGLLKIAKADLPQGLGDSFTAKPPPQPGPSGPPQLVMQRFDPNQAPEAPPPEPGAKPKVNPAKPGAAPQAGAATVYKGCTIISFQTKSFQNVQGCAEVVIRNDTDQMVMIRPGEVSCTTSDGARHVARNIITDAFPPAVKRREFVPPQGQLDDIFAFANEPLAITSVEWSR